MNVRRMPCAHERPLEVANSETKRYTNMVGLSLLCFDHWFVDAIPMACGGLHGKPLFP